MHLIEAFNVCVLLCGNNVLKQKTVRLFMACYVDVVRYNTFCLRFRLRRFVITKIQVMILISINCFFFGILQYDIF
jgi:hypothetical protein